MALPVKMTWAEEFRRLIPEGTLSAYIHSCEPRSYGAIDARVAGYDELQWLARSIVIGLEHEFIHYFASRVTGAVRGNVFDELITDLVGLARGCGSDRASLALRFLGLDSFPEYRGHGRLEAYRGQRPLSDETFRVVRLLTFRSVGNLARVLHERRDLFRDVSGIGRLTLAVTELTLEKLASSEISALVTERLS